MSSQLFLTVVSGKLTSVPVPILLRRGTETILLGVPLPSSAKVRALRGAQLLKYAGQRFLLFPKDHPPRGIYVSVFAFFSLTVFVFSLRFIKEPLSPAEGQTTSLVRSITSLLTFRLVFQYTSVLKYAFPRKDCLMFPADRLFFLIAHVETLQFLRDFKFSSA